MPGRPHGVALPTGGYGLEMDAQPGLTELRLPARCPARAGVLYSAVNHPLRSLTDSVSILHNR
jgi:hypothetical protein